jgi:hypothetical protein
VTHQAKASSAGSTAGTGSSRGRFSTLGLLVALAILALGLTAGPASAATPTPTMGSITEVLGSSAHASGSVDPADQETFYYFQYSTDQVNWTNGPFEGPIAANAGTTPVQSDLSGLKGSTKYYARLAAINFVDFTEVQSPAPYVEFTTQAVAAPTVLSIDSAGSVAYATAQASGEVERPAGSDSAALNVDCRFEYVPDAQFLSTGFENAPRAACEPENPVTAPGPNAVAANLTGLAPNTKYHLRLFAENAGGNDSEEASTFTTLAVTKPTVVSVDPASNVANKSAELSGVVERPAGSDPIFDSECRFEYITDQAYQAHDEKQKLIVKALGGSYTLTLYPDTTGDIAFNAPASTVQAALEGLSDIGAGNVTVTGGPGSPSGSQPYTILFTGALAETNLEQIAPDASKLKGPKPVAKTEVQVNGHEEGFNESQRSPCEPNPLITSAGPSPVTGTGSGLLANTVYHLQLTMVNAGGSDSKVAPNFKTTAVTQAQTLNATDITDTTATLVSRINAFNAPVTYQFEWGTTTSYGNVVPASPELFPYQGELPHSATSELGGLLPATTYHYRVLATNTQTNATVEGEDQVFTTESGIEPPAEECPNEASRVGFSAGLPDCRTYEFASPGLNNAGLIGPPAESPQASADADGNGIVYQVKDGPLDSESTGAINTIHSFRTPSGWKTKSLMPPLTAPIPSFFSVLTFGVSEDAEEWSAVSSVPPTQEAAEEAPPTVPPQTNFYVRHADGRWEVMSVKPNFAAGFLENNSPDFSHLYFNTEEPQFPEDPGGIYEWSNGELRHPGVLPNGDPAPGAQLANGYYNPINHDGSYVLFSHEHDLYLRVNAQETLHVTKSERTPPDAVPAAAPTISGGIADDGSQVLFVSRSELTEDANTGVEDAGADLYAYDVATEDLTDLTVSTNPGDAAKGANVTQFAGGSTDMSYLYFVATGKLAPGAVSGEPNLYSLHNGVTTFVAPGTGAGSFYVTPDGQHISFMSTESLTGYDNTNPLSGEAIGMVYKYTYGGALECASCHPDGSPPTGLSSFGFGAGTFRHSNGHNRVLSDDGSRVFFQSTDPILPQATNGLFNVYEYTGGEVHLLTPGNTESTITLMDASASGDDVFIATNEELAPGSSGGTTSAVYDLRVNAETKGPNPPTPCIGENCRGSGTAPSGVPSPGTAGFEAATKLIAPKSKDVEGKRVQLRIYVPGSGQLSVSGSGFKGAKKPTTKAGFVTVSIALKKGADKMRLGRGIYRTTADVVFTPSGGEVSRASVSLKFKAPAGAKRKGGN